MYRMSGWLLAAVVLVVGTPAAMAGGDCRACAAPACTAACASASVERTVMVPTWVTETRTVTCTECVPEQREKTVTVYKRVPVEKTVEREYTVMVPQQKTKTVTYTECVPTWEEKVVEYTVNVPHQETRQGVRKRYECMPVKETRTVCKDAGHWEERQVPVSTVRQCCYKARRCGLIARWRARRAARRACCESTCCKPSCCQQPSCCGQCDQSCGGCTQMVTKRVWVPNVIQQEVEVTVMRRQLVEEPYEYTVTVCRPETRTKTVKLCKIVPVQETREVTYTECIPEQRTKMVKVCKVKPVSKTKEVTYTECVPEKRTKTVRVCKMVPVEKTREVTYTVCVPEKRTRTLTLTSHKCVPEEKTVTYTVMVPHQVEREVQVRVCRMVPKTVKCCKPICGCCCQ